MHSAVSASNMGKKSFSALKGIPDIPCLLHAFLYQTIPQNALSSKHSQVGVEALWTLPTMQLALHFKPK